MFRNQRSKAHHPTQARAILMLACAAALVAGCQSGAPAATAPTSPAPTGAAAAQAPTARPKIEQQPVAGGPTLLRGGITLRKVVDVEDGSIRLARNPADDALYFLNVANGLFRVRLDPPASASKVVATGDITGDAMPSGMAFGPDGSLFVVANKQTGNTTHAIIRKGVASGGTWSFSTFAETEPYPMSNTPFDHLFNGIAVSPDGKSVFLNSGSRTDHGEVENNKNAFPDTREVPITSAIFRLPADAKDLKLPNDEAGLKPYLFADGTRNSYDLAFAPNGELFAGDNGPDADYPDELNWLREGQHYGFPWRFGNQDNPQQFPTYTSISDKRLQPDFTAVQIGAYRTDPTFPKPPGAFTNPVENQGPDAAQYRSDDGKQHDAGAEGGSLYSFTPHRSPLGLVFAAEGKLPADLRGDDRTLNAFILSWGAAGGTLTDKGKDLLQLRLTKQGDTYTAVTTQIARDFKNPIDAVMIENRLYVLEFSSGSAIWELTFE